MLRTMDEILGLSPTVFWPIIVAVVVLGLVVLTVLLVCCCYHRCCKKTRKNKVSSHDDCESTTQLTSCRSDTDLVSYSDIVEKGGSVMWPRYAAKVDSIEHELPVVNFNQKRAILPLPRNFSKFIIDTIVPLFNKQLDC